MNVLVFLYSLIIISLNFGVVNSNLVKMNTDYPDFYTYTDQTYLEKNTRVKQSLLKKIGFGLSKITGFAFKNYDRILSKKFLAALIIIGAPYLYLTDTDLLSVLSKHTADFTFKMSGAVSEGILSAIVRNPMALSKIVAALTVSKAGQKVVEKVGIKLAEAFLTIVTIGTIS